ncbi:serine carboxypeptidase, putative [Ricinus communis]|uniref:Serine carboxypeptidase, putative n=1 Tax=Ricinus communis TaxID=3988 RepID=B9T8Z3_RICCO|nr:serine carboxypeptidase, putative [Ricinus communis]|eukprot:XP_025015802.1 serine carboxypeptidase-like 7 [Ricinus communis]
MGIFVSLICLHVFLVLYLFSHITVSQRVVTSLPGFDGQLPFYLETGYIGVGKFNESQLFYYFVKSQRSPALDPLVLWISGGPGCSSLTAFIYENGNLFRG